MYYYIMEQPNSLSERKRQQKIKDILSNLGIAGEIVTPSPARSVDELTEIGISKGYSTIVAIGDERHTSKILSNILGKDIVLGLVPLDEPMLSDLIGAPTIEDACQTLKYRKLRTLDIAKIEPKKYFLTKATISNAKIFKAKIKSPNFLIETPASQICIFRDLEIIISDQSRGKNFFKKFFLWLFGKKEKDIYSSRFKGKKLLIETTQSMPVKVGNEAIAKTPISIRLLPEALKIIVSRANIKTKE